MHNGHIKIILNNNRTPNDYKLSVYPPNKHSNRNYQTEKCIQLMEELCILNYLHSSSRIRLQ